MGSENREAAAAHTPDLAPALAPDLASDLAARLDRAAAQCAARGVKLTAVRRDVLGLIMEAHGPLGAYTLLDRLRAQTGHGHPPTVYRALDFLVEQGFIHKIERLNAFVPCHDAHAHAHPVQFLICRACGTAQEIEDEAISQAIAQAARAAGFTVKATMVEIDGICADCAAKGAVTI